MLINILKYIYGIEEEEEDEEEAGDELDEETLGTQYGVLQLLHNCIRMCN